MLRLAHVLCSTDLDLLTQTAALNSMDAEFAV